MRTHCGSKRRISAQTRVLPAVPAVLRPVLSVTGSATGAGITLRPMRLNFRNAGNARIQQAGLNSRTALGQSLAGVIVAFLT